MFDVQKQIDAEIRALIEKEIQSTECIYGWVQTPTDDIVVCLCNKELAQEIQPIEQRLGETVGQGRTLVFAIESGRWSQVATGLWGGGRLRLEKCFASLTANQPVPKWQLGLELCQKWRIWQTDQPNQAEVDEFLARIDSESDPGSIWLDFRSQFITWVRRRGFLA